MRVRGGRFRDSGEGYRVGRVPKPIQIDTKRNERRRRQEKRRHREV